MSRVKRTGSLKRIGIPITKDKDPGLNLMADLGLKANLDI